MALTKFIFKPEQDGYSVAPGKTTLSVQLDGGASRSRLDMLGATFPVSVEWNFSPAEYKYAFAFYNSVTKSGSLPFLIDLLLDAPEINEYEAKFVPDTFKLSSQRGWNYKVTAQLEVKPLEPDEEFNLAYVDLINEYGSFEALTAATNQLEILVNIVF